MLVKFNMIQQNLTGDTMHSSDEFSQFLSHNWIAQHGSGGHVAGHGKVQPHQGDEYGSQYGVQYGDMEI